MPHRQPTSFEAISSPVSQCTPRPVLNFSTEGCIICVLIVYLFCAIVRYFLIQKNFTFRPFSSTFQVWYGNASITKPVSIQMTSCMQLITSTKRTKWKTEIDFSSLSSIKWIDSSVAPRDDHGRETQGLGRVSVII